MMKTIVTDTYDFPTLIRNGNVYVDKTAYLHRLVSKVDGTLFFMSRPRRFGKSLMISTLEQIFKGNRALFRGLSIAKSDYDWVRYPIVRLDMTAFDHTSGLAQFKRSLAEELGGTEPVAAFRALIAKKAKSSHGKGVVVLIDEYDSPVSGLLDRPDDLRAMREFLQTFYRILKQEAASVRFLMMTGVSKFTKLSVFSGLNNLTDLTMEPAYAGLLGYTHEELMTFFQPQIEAFARTTGRTSQEVVDELLDWYDSYRFSPKSETCVCNPVSVGRALIGKSCEAFWERTGSATLIVERLRKLGKLPIDVERVDILPKRLDVCDLQNLPFAALMYQGGYLTIKSVAKGGVLVLGIPNREVREAIYGGFLDEALKGNADRFSMSAFDLRNVLAGPEVDRSAITGILTSVFSLVPHEWRIRSEAEAKRYFLLFMKMAGASVSAEVESSGGRADAIVETDDLVCIFEFKYGRSAKAALRQIEENGYAKPYASDRRKVLTIGVCCRPTSSEIELAVGEVNPVGGEVNRESGEVNGEVKSYIAGHPGCRRKELLTAVCLAPRTLDRLLARLVAGQTVEFRGAPKNGGYYLCTERKRK